MSANDSGTTIGAIAGQANVDDPRDAGGTSEESSATDEDHNLAAEAMEKKPLLRASLMPEECIKRYTTGHVYIFDDVGRGEGNRATSDVAHEDACDRINHFFNHNTGYQIHNVTPAVTGTTRAQFMKWWRRQLASHGKDEFHIVYFHGDAFGRDETFTWQFRSRPASINAYQLFEITNRSGRDCLYILDCFIATRFEHPHRLRRDDGGHSDYTIGGALMPDGHGNFEHTSGFTARLTEYLAEFKDGINSRFQGWVKRKSIPELLHKDKDLVSNPLRLWASRTARDENVSRFCIEPEDIRQIGTFEFIRVDLKGIPKSDATSTSTDDGKSADPSETQPATEEAHDDEMLDQSNDDDSSDNEHGDSVHSYATTHIHHADSRDSISNVDGIKREPTGAAPWSGQIIDLTTEDDGDMDIKQEQAEVDPRQVIDLSIDDDDDNDVTMTSDEDEHNNSADSLFMPV